MKIIHYTILLVCLLACFHSKAQSGPPTFTTHSKADTNLVVYDENGKALRFHQYIKLLSTGNYTIWSNGSRSHDPNVKLYIKKNSLNDEVKASENINHDRTLKSGFLKVGKKLDLSVFNEVMSEADLDRKVKVLIFWTSECYPCMEGFKGLNQIFKHVYNPDEVIILAITPDRHERVAKALKAYPLDYSKMIFNAGGILSAYNHNQFPAYVILDKNDTIQFSVAGIGPEVLQMFETRLSSILNQ
jgi:thiol-disulfide isomerase/thioredoxin